MSGAQQTTVHQIEFGNFGNIPLLMKEMAAQLRAGTHGSVRTGVAVFLREDGTPIVCGWGQDADDIHAIGLLHLGAAWLCSHEVRRK